MVVKLTSSVLGQPFDVRGNTDQAEVVPVVLLTLLKPRVLGLDGTFPGVARLISEKRCDQIQADVNNLQRQIFPQMGVG